MFSRCCQYDAKKPYKKNLDVWLKPSLSKVKVVSSVNPPVRAAKPLESDAINPCMRFRKGLKGSLTAPKIMFFFPLAS